MIPKRVHPKAVKIFHVLRAKNARHTDRLISVKWLQGSRLNFTDLSQRT
jgi:hypothetical protein